MTGQEEVVQILTEAVEDPFVSPAGLIGRLMHQNLMDYQGVASSVMESQEKRISDLEATLAAVRAGVEDLFTGLYMPTESAILGAVFQPSPLLIESCRKDSGRGPM